jgi:hypothetical protein
VTAPAESADASQEIGSLLTQEEQLRGHIAHANSTRAQLKRRRSAVDQALQTLRSEERRVRTAIEKVGRGLKNDDVDIDISSLIMIKSDLDPLEALGFRADLEILAVDNSVNPEVQDSLTARLASLESRRDQLQQESESAANVYQAYLIATAEWKEAIADLRGDTATPAPESLAGLRRRREDLTNVKPALLQRLAEARRAKCREIFRVLEGLVGVNEAIARPVREYIESNKLTREYYRLAFDVRISESGLADRLFGLVGQQSGTFAGVQQGHAVLRNLLNEADFSSADGVLAFADQLFDRLTRDHKTEARPPVDLSALLKKGATVAEVYDLVYALEYLKPTFELGLNNKALRLLSPGERGILLLVFYLVVDLSDEPLIIDQPEGNLNNQSIVDHLVPVIVAAKGRRQIIIVTHNPNIAVVCDAEQIIHCEMDQGGSHAVRYCAGALENPQFNRLSLDLLEGTGAALDARVSTYDRPQMARMGVIELPVIDWIV